MKTINVTYGKDGKICDISDTCLYFEQEHNSLMVTADIDTDKSVRAYIRASNNNSDVLDATLSEDGFYSVLIEDTYMSKGTLCVGFEVYDGEYAERFEPVKIYIDSFVNLGAGSSDNVYTVTVNVGQVHTLPPSESAYAENVGTAKDAVFNFGIPRGEKGDAGYTPKKGVDYFTEEDIKSIIDDKLSEESENAVQNKVVTKAIDEIKGQKADLATNRASGTSIQLADSTTSKLCGLKLFGKTMQISNLFDVNSIPASKTRATYSVKDCSLTLKPTSDEGTVKLAYKIDGKKNTDYYVSGNWQLFNFDDYIGRSRIIIRATADGAGDLIGAYDLYSNADWPCSLKETIGFTFNSGEYDTFYLWFYFNATSSGSQEFGDSYAVYSNIQIAEGTTEKQYKPYGFCSFKGIGDKGNVEVTINEQSLDVGTPNGLLGIPVKTNGNYTDANNQQWICDEIDFEKEIYIQRIGKIQSYNGEEITTSYLSTTGNLTDGATVIYVLKTPVETRLSDEEISMYKKLQTYKPTTIITNDEDAYMQVDYTVDIKTYIDNKFTELYNAILSTGGNI